MVYSNESLNKQVQDAWVVTINGYMPEHPSPKPYDAMTSCCAALMLKPFSTPSWAAAPHFRAARDLGRKPIGIEIEEKYCEIAAKRLSQEVLDFSGGGK